MPIKPKPILLSGLFALCQILSAQVDYRDACIFSLNGDTISGHINLQTTAKLAKSCSFRTRENAKPVIYYPGDIRGFRFTEGRYFVSRKLFLDGNFEELFLEFMVDGVVDLFYLRLDDKDRYFVERDSLIELVNQEVSYINREGEEQIRSDERYKGTLKYLFMDDPGLYRKIDAAGFHQRSLIDITASYHRNTCKAEKCHIYTPKSGPDISVGTRANCSLSILKYQTSGDYDLNMTYFPGIQARIKPVKVRDRWGIVLLCDWSSYSFEGTYTNTVLNNYGPERDYLITLDYQLISLPVMIEYVFPFRSLKPVLAVGFNNAIVFGVSNTLKIENAVQQEDLPVDRYFCGGIASVGLVRDLNEKMKIYVKAEYRFLRALSYQDYFDYIRPHSTGLVLGFDYTLY